MNQQDFKNKYFTNNFYWINEDNYRQIQEIAIELGCVCHTGENEIIEWHEGFKNLGFRTYDRNDGVTVFQKEDFLSHNEKATSFHEMIKDRIILTN